MAKGVRDPVVQQIQRTLLLEQAGCTDEQLLRRFVEHGDELAFAAIVRHHGPLVFGVCRRLLPHHDAEDAFQATFLVLVRKAASIAAPALLANWLHGVAFNAARKAKLMIARRRTKERQAAIVPEAETRQPDLWCDLDPLLDQELRRLPEKYRLPILLCDLKGTPRKEAARQLQWSEGTLSGRLARARAMLAKRLAQRGVVVSGGMLATALLERTAAARVPTELVASTIKAASLFAVVHEMAEGAISTTVVAIAKGVLKSMLSTKLKISIAILLTIGLIAVGGGLVVSQTAPAPSSTPEPTAARPKGYPPAPRARERRYQVECTLIKSDADGRDFGIAGRGKLLAQPVLRVTEGAEATFLSGGELAVPPELGGPVDYLRFGVSVQVKIVGLDDGRLRLQTTLENSNVGHDDLQRTQIDGKIVRSVAVVKLGEPIRLTMKDDAGQTSHWLTIKVVKEETVSTRTRTAASDAEEKVSDAPFRVGVTSDAGLTGNVVLNERNFDIIGTDVGLTGRIVANERNFDLVPTNRDPGASRELARLREQVKGLEQRLAAVKTRSTQTDAKDAEGALYTRIKNDGLIGGPRVGYTMWVRGVTGKRLIQPVFKRLNAQGDYEEVITAKEAEVKIDTQKSELVIQMRQGIAATPDGTRASFEERVFAVPLPLLPDNRGIGPALPQSSPAR